MFDPKTLTLEQIVKQMNAAVMRDEFKLLKHLCETAHSNFDVSVHNRDVSNLKTEPLETAIEYERKDMVAYLLPYSTFAPDAFNTTTALDVCLRCDQADLAALVLPYYSGDNLSKYLTIAAEQNMWRMVDVISQHVNADAPEYQNVLLWASCLGNQKALEQYYTIERGQNVLQRVELSRDPNHCPEDDAFREVYPEHIEMLVEHHQLQVFRNKLHNSVAPHVDQKNPQPKSKI